MKNLKFPVAVFLIAMLVSCTKEPTACFESSKLNVEVHDVITLNNCSEDADSYEWTIEEESIQRTDSRENPQASWRSADSYNITLEAFSKNEKKSDMISKTISVSDICYTCIYSTTFGTTSVELCASDAESREDFDNSIDEVEDAGWSCTKN